MSNPPSFSDMHSEEPSPIGFEMLAPKTEDAPPAREGLPATFRMRADSHYVDLLDSTPSAWRVESIAVARIEPRDPSRGQPVPELVESIRRHGVLQPLIVQKRVGRTRLLAGQKRLDAALAAGLPEVPCIVRDVDDELAEEVTAAANVFSRIAPGGAARERSSEPTTTTASVEAGEELARSITTLGTSAALLDALPSDLTRRVTTSLMRAEISRATCLLQALRILRAEVDGRRTRIDVQPLVAGVLQAVEPERRLRGIQLHRDVALSPGAILADEELLPCVLSGLVVATFELVGGAEGQANVLAGVGPGGFFKFSITQDSVAAPPSWLAVVREERVRDRSMGFGAIAIAAARRLVEGSGGRVTLAESVRGTDIHVTIPGAA